MFLFTNDKKRLHKFFIKDQVLYSYHLGDLDDFYFENCQWVVCYDQKGKIGEAVLIYHGLSTPTVLAFGQSKLFGSLLEELIDILPGQFYCHFQQPHSVVFKRNYRETYLGRHQKMRLDNPGQVAKYSEPDESVTRLDHTHERLLRQLYKRAYPDNYFDPHMLDSGKYLGWFDSDRLAAVAGVHVDSAQYKISVLGNITTDPDFRGRGLATKLTAILCSELVAEGKLICLNVKCDNAPAIKCYSNLGFVKIHEYEEALYQNRL